MKLYAPSSAPTQRQPRRDRLIHFVMLAVMSVSGGLVFTGCDQPCDRLAERLCNQKGVDSAQCAAWESRSKRVSTKTCERALRMLDRERIR